MRESFIALLLVVSLTVTSGCAGVFNGLQETVTIRTVPSGRQVLIDGVRRKDGDTIVIQKHAGSPTVIVEQNDHPRIVRLTYSPDPWLIADAALLLLWVVPGVIALAVDFGTGGWRNLDDVQMIYLNSST